MIEVEIRGKLDEQEYQNLKTLLQQKGIFKGSHKREMYLLYDYPGYDPDPIKREVDIRLRNTDGFCEIMVKHKASEGNRARREISLRLTDNSLDSAKEVVRALGCRKALKMIREKEIFELDGVEWSLVNCPPKNIRYFEAEKEVKNESSIALVERELSNQAQTVGQKILNHTEMKEFIFWLDKEVNLEIEL